MPFQLGPTRIGTNGRKLKNLVKGLVQSGCFDIVKKVGFHLVGNNGLTPDSRPTGMARVSRFFSHTQKNTSWQGGNLSVPQAQGMLLRGRKAGAIDGVKAVDTFLVFCNSAVCVQSYQLKTDSVLAVVALARAQCR
jgi:hypothetical protein